MTSLHPPTPYLSRPTPPAGAPPPPPATPLPPPSAAALAGPAELPIGECAALIGLDWGDQRHAIALWARATGQVETRELPHSAESVHAWLDQLKIRFGGERVGVAVEASKGAIVAALLEPPWLLIYPVHPATSRRFSTAFTPSGAKGDGPDAQTLLEILRGHRGKLRALLAHDPETRRLGLLAEARRKLVDDRTFLSNQLTSLLKGYYPQALALTGDKRYAPLALAFVEKWPAVELLQRAKPETVRRFYQVHQVRRPAVIKERLALIAAARPLTTDRGLCEVSQLQLHRLVAELRVLARHLTALEEKRAEVFAAHPEAALFRSLPGAGAAMAPRLSVLFGTDRARWLNPGELQTYYGIAPVTEQSGGHKRVHWRWSAPLFARQTLVEWTGQSVKYSRWAKAYYLQQKARQKPHSTIIRSLAFKWLRILWRCWQDRQPYDEARYLAALEKRNPTLFA
ncbi:MAG TPA: transposase, partial [Chthoniobacteraceae bacterium]|nr:transposase [Chthoniobacteraceae bacterium]